MSLKQVADKHAPSSSIGTSCLNLIAGQPVCIYLPPYRYPGPILAGAIFTPDQLPVPRQPDIVSGCTKFEYTDNDGRPGLANLLLEHGITRHDWNVWNWPT